MNKRIWMIVGSVLTVLVVIGAVGAVAVYAQSPTPPTPSAGQGAPGGPGNFGGGPHELGQAELNAAAKALGITADDLSAQLKSGKTLDQIATAKGVDPKTVMEAIRAARPLMLGSTELDAAAKALGMTSADLSAELQSGKTLSDVATEKGVSMQTVQDAVQAARNTEMTTQIKQAVTDGKITQDKANWLLEGLDKGYLNGPDSFGFGFGHGPGGPHMPAGQQPQATPSTTP
jgi:predicted transcriptional regulator